MMDDRTLTTPTRQLVADAIDAGDAATAKKLVHQMEHDWLRNKEYSINWIASLLSFIGERFGEPMVEQALRDFGERFLRQRRAGVDQVPARKVAEAVARAMKANGGTVTRFAEDDEKFTLEFDCGSGGMLISSGAYADERHYLTLKEPGPMRADLDEMPVYCAHCPMHNEIQPIEWTGHPTTVQFPGTVPGERCVHHVYKDVGSIPSEVYARAGKG
jgi:hypothetical protein